ncbi:MAG: MtnX-like HAD-IB family phosphatase [Dehalococcoidales bacterium]
MKETQKTIVQCDFDGTVTEEDVSFIILDAFGSGEWRQLFRDYQEGKITVGHFNSEAFSTVKTAKESLLEIVRKETTMRPGFQELIDCCLRLDFRFVIVSNGLQFYIEDILTSLGMPDIEVYAAQTAFRPEGLIVQYIGPDGDKLDNDFKLAYTNSFLHQGYRVIYIGDGESDLSPAKISHQIFATGTLLERCRETNLSCTPFTNHNQVVSSLESWQ